MEHQIRNRIFELLKEISGSKNHNGLLIVFSDLRDVLARGAYPLGGKKELNEFQEVCHINNEEAGNMLKKVGKDGAVLIDERGFVFSPAVYLNVNLFSVDKNEIEPEFCARHIAALATSTSTNASVYALSEETGKVREFIEGKIKRKYPGKEQEKVLEIIKKDLREVEIGTKEV